MTNKLAEAIKLTGAACDSGLMLEVNVAKDIVEAARKYHALPVVDVDKSLKDEINNSVAIDYLDARQACCALLRFLSETYPDGLRWVK